MRPSMGKVVATRQELVEDPVKSAAVAGLQYVSPEMPGIYRKKSGTFLSYVYPTGRPVRQEKVLGRIKSLVIPPAWTDVWICPDPKGHLQATGRDGRGRKQYRYHPRWREVREETKYERMLAFGKALPKIRRRVKADLRLKDLSRRNVLATVTRLLEVSLIRVGNDEYVRENNSFGLTTMKNRHVDVNGSEVLFEFRGKGGKRHRVAVEDRRLAQVVRKCQDLPGQELFQYVAQEGKRQDVKSSDVNEYLREITGEDFTAKDFRTWAGTVLAAMALREFEQFNSKAEAKKNILRGIERVAERLGNTPSICRKCYIHPEVINAYLDGTLVRTLKRRVRARLARSNGKLPPEEAAVLGFLERRLAAANANGIFFSKSGKSS